MHKLYTALFVILAFSSYAIARDLETAQAVAAVTPSVSVPVAAVPAPAVTPAPATPATPVPAPATAPRAVATTKKGKYVDGTYTGVAADAFYGQVQVVVSGGRIADITFLSYPSDRSQSRQISESAMRGLVSQAIATQSAHVSGVSGATDTTAAFRDSLSSALAQAA